MKVMFSQLSPNHRFKHDGVEFVKINEMAGFNAVNLHKGDLAQVPGSTEVEPVAGIQTHLSQIGVGEDFVVADMIGQYWVYKKAGSGDGVEAHETPALDTAGLVHILVTDQHVHKPQHIHPSMLTKD